ncbi:MAG: PD40 domain-containing protein, partial [Anaerolineales bacterium]|nr:PD40 domain-containing protein [Anaerolineales bacterium]
VYLMKTDGSSLSNLTNNPAEDSYPAWAIIGQWIAFTSNRSGNNEIFAMNADGSQQTNMTNDPADDNYPSWY